MDGNGNGFESISFGGAITIIYVLPEYAYCLFKCGAMRLMNNFRSHSMARNRLASTLTAWLRHKSRLVRMRNGTTFNHTHIHGKILCSTQNRKFAFCIPRVTSGARRTS